jgi:hypothetical protein
VYAEQVPSIPDAVGRARAALCWLSVLLSCTCTPAARSGDAATRADSPRAAERSSPSNESPPPPALPALQRARLDYLFDAAGLLAHDWPLMSGADICVLLLAEAQQWVVNCDEAPATGFARLSDDFRGHPVFGRNGGTFASAGRELSTPELLAVMPAAAHVEAPGARSSDLPARHAWLLLGSLEGLTQYHAAFRGSTTEEWLSVAMHEFLHTEQLRVPGFADDLRLINAHAIDPAALTALYTKERAYRARVEREYALLVQAVSHASLTPSAAQAALRAWLGLYRKRRADLAARTDGAALVRSDSLFTYLEGVARYAESSFLVNAAQHPPGSISGDDRFHGFAKWAGGGYAEMPNRQLDAQYYYALGFHLGLLLDRVDPTWKRSVHDEPDWLVGTVVRWTRLTRGKRIE